MTRRISWLVAVAAVLAASMPRAALSQDDPEDFWPFERFINYPYKTSADLAVVNATARKMLADPQLRSMRSDDGQSHGIQFLRTVLAFTKTPQKGRLSIVSFANSDNPAVVRLRHEVRLAPPAGGAILRVYESRNDMPPEIRKMFEGSARGITWWGRYMAVLSERMSEREFEDTVEHELAHAYVMCLLGMDTARLPRWFHEGMALHISGGRLQYVSHVGFGQSEIHYSPKDYNRYRLAFDYITAIAGSDGTARFIRQAVEQKSVTGPLEEVSGAASHAELMSRAQAWQGGNQWWRSALVVAGVAVVLLLPWWLTVRHRRRVQRALMLIEEARTLARSGLREAALDNLARARRTEPYASRVRLALQRALDDIQGYHGTES